MVNFKMTVKILTVIAVVAGLSLAVIGGDYPSSVKPMGYLDDNANFALKDELAPQHEVVEPYDPANPPEEEIAMKQDELLSMTTVTSLAEDSKKGPVQATSSPLYTGGNRVDLIYEGFETSVPPAGWTLESANPSYTWNQTIASSYEGSASAEVVYDPALVPQDEWLITPSMDLSDGTAWVLDFAWLMSYYWGVDPYDNYDLEVHIRDGATGAWTLLFSDDNAGVFESWTWYTESIPLTAYLGYTEAQFGFRYAGSDGAQGNFDAISVNDAALPTGRCCSGVDYLDCDVLTEADCAALSGHWTLNGDCSEGCPVVPANDDPENAVQLYPPETVIGSTEAATIDCPGELDWNAVWYVFEAPFAENDVYINYCGTPTDIYSVGIVVFGGGLPIDCPNPIIANSYAFNDCGDGTTNPDMTWERLPGPATYYFPAHADDGAKGGMPFQFDIAVTESAPLPPGASCSDPLVLSLGAGDLPYPVTALTCGMGNLYENTCLGYYDGGEDYIIELTLTENMMLDFVMDPQGTTYTGFMIADVCGDGDGTCIDYATNSGSSVYSMLNVELLAGTYYMMFDTWPSPDCIPSFQLMIMASPPPTSGDNCSDPLTVKLPDDMTGGNGSQYVDNNSNCGRGNDYSATCLGSYDGGEDIIYMLDVGVEMAFNFLLSPDVGWTGIMVSDVCGDGDGTCLDYSTASSGSHGIYSLTLPVGFYYVMIDTYPTPDCIPAFTLTIEEAVIVEDNDSWEFCDGIGDVTDLAYTTDDATPDGPMGCQTAPNKWFCYTATCDGQMTVSLCGSSYDTKLAVYDGADPFTATMLGCNDDACGIQSELTGLPAVAGNTYLIEVGGYSSNTGDGLLTVSCSACDPPENDNCEDVTPVVLTDGVPHTFTGDNTCATEQCASFPGGHVWEAFTLTTTADVTLDYCGTSPAFGNAWLNLALGCPCASFTDAGAYNFDDCGDGNVTITWEGLDAGTYYYPVMLDPDNGAEGPYTITVFAGVPSTLVPDPTAIDFGAQAPGSMGSTSLTLTAAGGTPISYSISYTYDTGTRGFAPYTDLGSFGADKAPYTGSDYVNPTERQGGDDVSSATVISGLPYTDNGTTVGYIDDYDEVCPYSGATAPDVVYSYTPAANITVDISLCNSAYDTKLFLYENTVTPGAPFACNDDACPGYMSALYQLELFGGNTYYIVVDGYGSNAGDYQLDIEEYFVPDPFECPPGAGTEAEACGDATNGGCNMTTPAFEPIECGETVCGTVWADGDTRDTDWYLLTLYSTSTVTINGSANFPFVCGFVDTADCALAASLDPYATGNPNDVVSVQREAGPGIYYVFFSHQEYTGYPCGTSNDYWLNIDCPAGPVLWLSASPESGTIPAGGNTTIMVNYDATELTDGVYNADLVFTHDGANSITTVPVTLTIGGVEMDTVAIDPGLIGVYMMNAINPIDGYIYIADGFDATYNVADIDPATCLINGTIVPTAYTVTTMAGFEGDVLVLTFDLAAFAAYLAGGELVWDCSTESFTVTGDYYGGGSFATGDNFEFCGHISGDLNVDGQVDISDLVRMVEFMFGTGEPPIFMDLANVNGTGGVDISDLVHWATWAFQGGPPLQHP